MTDQFSALPQGFQLQEHHIEYVLGSGGFGITYYARDIHLDKPVAIKEYLPREFATRVKDGKVVPASDKYRDDYDWGLSRFLDEARALARFDHPNINKVHRFFEANGTAYLVLEFVEGETLADKLARTGQLSEAALTQLLLETLSGLQQVHAAGYVHRDIKPGNLMLRQNGSVVLLDFGAARQVVVQRSQSLTTILTPGYAPIEQYDQKAEDIGPWTDIYALGMVAYRSICGCKDSELLDAVARARAQRKGQVEDAMAPAKIVGKGRFSPQLLAAVDWAIEVNEEDRPQSAQQLYEVLADSSGAEGHASSSGPISPTIPIQHPTGSAATIKRQPAPASPQVTGPKSRRIVVTSLLFSLLAAGLGYWYLTEKQDVASDQPTTVAEPQLTEPAPKSIVRPSPEESAPAETITSAPAHEIEQTPTPATRVELTSDDGFELVTIPGGCFLMGSPASEPGRANNERQHEVCVETFRLGRYEITQAQWAREMDDNPSEFTFCDSCPVEKVSWQNVQGYLAKLNARTGRHFRLPTETEWAYGCNGGRTGQRYCGGDNADQLAWYQANSDAETHPVGQLLPNHLGLYDMSGNVWEWTCDQYDQDYGGTCENAGTDAKRVIRGGAWSNSLNGIRAAARDWAISGLLYNFVGFRLAEDVEDNAGDTQLPKNEGRL